MIAIVTDSTADLTPALLSQYGVTSVPLYVLFDGVMHKDGLEIHPADIFAGVGAGKAMPSTSQPSPAEFAAAYEQALQGADEVLSLHISGLLSGTVGSARLAAEDFGGRVRVLDSHSVTVGLGMRVARAAGLVQQGRSMDEVVAELERVSRVAEIKFTVDSLDYLKKNGRIGGAAALLGGLLNIKPILAVQDGRVQAAGRARGAKKAQAEILASAHEFLKKHGRSRVAFLYTEGGLEVAQELRATLQGDIEDFGFLEIGAVIAAHAGPGAYGLALEPLS